MLRFDRPLAVAVLFLVGTVVSARAQVSDHLKCYQVRDPLSLKGTADLNTSAFGLDPGCKISKTKFFCVPGTKTNIAVIDKTTKLPITPLPVSGPDPGDRVCYKAKCPVAVIPDQAITDQFGTRTVTTFKAAYLCTPAVRSTFQRFVDNGDGTVTDHNTGLQWEKKQNLDSIPNLADPRDADNVYTLTATIGGTPLNGTAITDLLDKLNGAAGPITCFANQCDWRLPTLQELESILIAPFPCGHNPCIDPSFGPTSSAGYWSATTLAILPSNAWIIGFSSGLDLNGFKSGLSHVRAVRAGS